MDGVGLGPDGTVWGGEVMVADACGYERVAHLAPVPLPGGDRCAREGWRMAAAYGIEQAPPGVDERAYARVLSLARSDLPAVTTSCGRLFDAVASVLGVCQVSTYEGEAAARLEAVCDPGAGEVVELELEASDGLVRELAARHAAGEPAARLAAVFHTSLARAIVAACVRTGLEQVALSGGCFQNRRLLEQCWDGLGAAGLRPYSNQQVPVNDGGLSLGQAMVAACSG
jgi:hydrogenase maturation protein HypF